MGYPTDGLQTMTKTKDKEHVKNASVGQEQHEATLPYILPVSVAHVIRLIVCTLTPKSATTKAEPATTKTMMLRPSSFCHM